jgi:membrane fusion protein, peptide pheromone/bacteriocin exporter
VQDCVEAHIASHAPSGKALYLTIVGLVLTGAASMPFIQVPVVVQADGIIRPSIERQEARAAESGVVSSVRVADGTQVEAGDTLLTLDVASVAARLALLDSIAQAQTADLADLELLLAAAEGTLAHIELGTAHRRQQLREHVAIEDDLLAHAAAERREAERVRALHGRGFATPEQVDRQQGLERTADAAVGEHRERMQTAWSDAVATLTNERRRLDVERSSLLETLSRHAVLAPVQGTVELSASLSPGSVLERGERVATISPNTDLIAETLLTPRDIGLVRPGTPVRLMVDAFNYRDWGVLDGVVSEISDDASLERERPRFRVRCRLARTELRLRGGQRASVKKGMTFRARFVVANRSLLQLLFDDVDDWLNPARSPAPTA